MACLPGSKSSINLPSNISACLDFVLANAGPGERPYLSVEVLGVSFLGFLDSGAFRTIVDGEGYAVLKSLGLGLREPDTKRCTIANGDTCEVVGIISVPFKVREKI